MADRLILIVEDNERNLSWSGTSSSRRVTREARTGEEGLAWPAPARPTWS